MLKLYLNLKKDKMPLKKSDKPKNVYYNIRELLADNAKKGKER